MNTFEQYLLGMERRIAPEEPSSPDYFYPAGALEKVGVAGLLPSRIFTHPEIFTQFMLAMHNVRQSNKGLSIQIERDHRIPEVKYSKGMIWSNLILLKRAHNDLVKIWIRTFDAYTRCVIWVSSHVSESILSQVHAEAERVCKNFGKLKVSIMPVEPESIPPGTFYVPGEKIMLKLLHSSLNR